MTNQPSSIIAEATNCIEQIYAHQYYVNIWEQCKHHVSLDQLTDQQIVAPFQTMWEMLPDAAEIRRKPFYLICDLAERACEQFD